MASNLLLAGVEAYLGALWPIHAGAGAAFAAQFFEYFLDGAPIGAAVRRARRAAAASSGANDLAWASYILYGDPGLSARRPK